MIFVCNMKILSKVYHIKAMIGILLKKKTRHGYKNITKERTIKNTYRFIELQTTLPIPRKLSGSINSWEIRKHMKATEVPF